jgi:hypothetical protein
MDRPRASAAADLFLADYFVRCAVRTAMLKSCTNAPEMSWSVET